MRHHFIPIKWKWKSLSHVWLCGTLGTLQAPLPMGFSKPVSWGGLPCPPPGDLLHPGIEPASLMSLALAGWFFTTSATREVLCCVYFSQFEKSLKRKKNHIGAASCGWRSEKCLTCVVLVRPWYLTCLAPLCPRIRTSWSSCCKICFWWHWLFFVAVHGLFLVVSGGYSLLQCLGFSLQWPLFLQASVVLALRLSYSEAHGILLDQGWNLCPQHLQVNSSPLYQQRSPGHPFWSLYGEC